MEHVPNTLMGARAARLWMRSNLLRLTANLTAKPADASGPDDTRRT